MVSRLRDHLSIQHVNTTIKNPAARRSPTHTTGFAVAVDQTAVEFGVSIIYLFLTGEGIRLLPPCDILPMVIGHSQI
jgi:hypothetical protein